MHHRPSPLAALAAAIAAFVVSLAFGSETFLREVVFENRSSVNLGTILSTLTAPTYARLGYGAEQGIGRFTFVVAFPLVLGLLVLALARGGNAFVAGWVSAVAAGGVAGFLRGLSVDDRYFGNGQGDLQGAFSLAGQGANYGFVIGWGVGLVALVAVLLTRRRSSGIEPVGAPLAAGSPGVGVPPAAWAPPGERPPPPPPAPAPAPASGPGRPSSWPPPPEASTTDATSASSSTDDAGPRPGGGSPWDRPPDPDPPTRT